MDFINSSQFAAHVDDLLKEHHVPGVAAAVYKDGKFASKGFGQASIEPPVACTAETLFDIASASKSITAASVALLVEDEAYPEVKWDAVVSELLPGDFVMPEEEYTRSATLDDIMGHRSGMPRHDSSYVSTDNAKSVTKNLRNLPVCAPIRSKYMYNNMMYTVATYLVEQKTGSSFQDFVQKHFFGPLGMDSTNIQASVARAKGLGDRLTTGHDWNEKEERYHTFPLFDDPAGIGAGSIVTSVNDYVKYVAALMNQEPPFTEDVYKGVTRPRTIANADAKEHAPMSSEILYAAGWEVHHYRGHRIIMHDGAISGSGTSHFFVPNAKFAGAVFGNCSSATEVSAVMASELIDEALDVPKAERPDWNAWVKKDHDEDEKDEDGNKIDPIDKIRRKLCPDSKELQPQEKPLDAYVGKYFNAGYHNMDVTIKNDKLFLDNSMRSFGFTLTLEHVCEQTKYIAHGIDTLDGAELAPMRLVFEFKDDKVVRFGLDIEEDLVQQDGFIWFDRI